MGRSKVMKEKMVFELALQWVMRNNGGNSRKCTHLVITVKWYLSEGMQPQMAIPNILYE